MFILCSSPAPIPYGPIIAMYIHRTSFSLCLVWSMMSKLSGLACFTGFEPIKQTSFAVIVVVLILFFLFAFYVSSSPSHKIELDDCVSNYPISLDRHSGQYSTLFLASLASPTFYKRQYKFLLLWRFKLLNKDGNSALPWWHHYLVIVSRYDTASKWNCFDILRTLPKNFKASGGCEK